jgi:CheY-like chemotaxis protein
MSSPDIPATILNLLLDSSPFGHAVYSAEGPCRWANQAFADILGVPLGRVLQQDYRGFEAWQSSGLIEAAMRALEEGSRQQRRFELIGNAGQRTHLYARIGAVQHAEETLLLLSVCNDAKLVDTERDRDAVAEALERAQAAHALADRRGREAVGRLAGSVAHHLNNQLMVLRGHLELLEENLGDHPGSRRFPALYIAIDQLEQFGRGVLHLGDTQPASGERHAVGEYLTRHSRSRETDTPATILLAEDEAELRSMVAEALHARGHRVLQAADGQAALELAGRHRGEIELLLTDVVMPGLGGVELAEALTEDRPKLRVLFMSGYAESVHAQLYGPASEGRYLQKPFSIHHLAAKVDQALADGRRGRRGKRS